MSETAKELGGDFFSGLRKAVDFVLVRHGKSEGNRLGLFQGRLDVPLSDEGREQASRRGALLAGERDTALFCSPLSRARETAELIARAGGYAAPRQLEALLEIDTGRLTGRAWRDFEEKEPEAFARFRAESWDSVEGAEGSEALYRRGLAAWTALRDRALDEELSTIIAVTHAGLLQWLVKTSLACRTWLPLLPTPNCAVYRLRVEPVEGGGAYRSWIELGTPLPPEPPR